MKNTITFLWVGLLCFGLTFSARAQKAQKPTYTQEQINAFIREVYQDQTESMFFNPKSGRLALVTNFLNRIEFLPNGNSIEKKLPLLSSLALINKYNPNLQRDFVFDPKTFNPLKYNFTMTARTKILIRVDASDYVIAIEPIL